MYVGGNVTQWEQDPLCKHEDLSPDPQHPHKTWEAGSCSPRARGGMETGGFSGLAATIQQ